MEFAHVSRLYLMNWLVYIHCYSQIHFVSSLICSLSRAGRKFYALISLIHLCKDHCFVLWSGRLLPMPPDLPRSLIDDTRMLESSIHMFYLLTWEGTCSILCGPCDDGSRSGTCGVVRKTGLFLCPAPVAVVVPKAADRYSQTGPVHDLHTLLFFFLFPDINFHHPCTSLSPPESLPS